MISHVTRRLRLARILPFLFFVSFGPARTVPKAQTAPPAPDSIVPGFKPADAPSDWKRIIGVYGKVRSVLLLERYGQLRFRNSFGDEKSLTRISEEVLTTDPNDPPVGRIILPSDDARSDVTWVLINDALWHREDAGSDPVHFYHVTPAQPVADLREKALKLSPPVERGPFRGPDFIELANVDPSIRLDIRYAGANNFLSTPVYTQARAFMQRPAAEALLRVLHKLQPLGYGLLIHDAYRPWYVTKIFWDATPPEGKIFVANPQDGSKHNRGCAVDLTLYDLANGQPVEMPGLYDEMSPRSFPDFPGGTSLQRWHRDLLRRAMESEGYTVNEDEWWHFDYKDWKQYGILNVPFEKLGIGQQPATVTH